MGRNLEALVALRLFSKECTIPVMALLGHCLPLTCLKFVVPDLSACWLAYLTTRPALWPPLPFSASTSSTTSLQWMARVACLERHWLSKIGDSWVPMWVIYTICVILWSASESTTMDVTESFCCWMISRTRRSMAFSMAGIWLALIPFDDELPSVHGSFSSRKKTWISTGFFHPLLHWCNMLDCSLWGYDCLHHFGVFISCWFFWY